MALDGTHVVQLCLTEDPFDPPGHERFGGGHLFLFDLGRYLVRTGARVTFVTRLNAPGKPLHQELGPRCEIFRVVGGPPADMTPSALGKYLEEVHEATRDLVEPWLAGVNVLHSHNWIAGFVARRLAALAPVRHIHTLLSLGRIKALLGEEPAESDPIRERAEVEVFQNADHLIAVCPNELTDLRTHYPEVSHDRVSIIPHGLNPDVFYPRPQNAGDFFRRTTARFQEGAYDVP
jgi:hypothetical protein